MKYVIVLFVLMYTVTFADGDTTGIEVVNYSVEDCDWDHCKKIEMIRFIEKNSNLDYDGSPLPDVVIQREDEICSVLYEKPMLECDIAGYYNDDTNIIYIRDGPTQHMVDDGFYETVLIHELVHFLQKINGVYETVECRAQLEADAFKIQDLYIDTVGIDENNKNDPLFAMLASMCQSNLPMLSEQ